MEEQLINFETAKLAKEKGFNIYTQKVFVETLEHTLEMGRGGDCTFPYQAPRVLNSSEFGNWDIVHCKAPTQSLLQKWLREVHNIHLLIEPYYNEQTVLIYGIDVIIENSKEEIIIEKGFKTYEQALEIGLQEALKLI